MRSYAAARGMFSFFEFLCWSTIIIGVITALVLGNMTNEFAQFRGRASTGAFISGMMPGLAVSFLGLVGLILTQIGRATVDSAEYGQQMLKVARDQLEVSRQGMAQGKGPEAGFASLQTDSAQTSNESPEASAWRERGKVGASEDTTPKTDDLAPTTPSLVAPYKPGEKIAYRSVDIEVVATGFVIAGEVHLTIGDAQKKVDQVLNAKRDV